jgi:hypothetical protein
VKLRCIYLLTTRRTLSLSAYQHRTLHRASPNASVTFVCTTYDECIWSLFFWWAPDDAGCQQSFPATQTPHRTTPSLTRSNSTRSCPTHGQSSAAIFVTLELHDEQTMPCFMVGLLLVAYDVCPACLNSMRHPRTWRSVSETL